MACLLWLSLVFHLDWLVDQSLAICGLDYLGLALSCCCLLKINSSFLHFYLFSFKLHLLLKNDVLSSLTPNVTKHLESKKRFQVTMRQWSSVHQG